ncbi:MAG: phosphodiester glycosidase family protein [Armatimonadota bacterium]
MNIQGMRSAPEGTHRSTARRAALRLGVVAGSLLGMLIALSEARGQAPSPNLPASVRHELRIVATPRPLRIHTVRIDLRDRALSFEVVAAPDPDRGGPAETVLTAPDALSKRRGAVGAINTAAWSMLPDPSTGKPFGYVADKPADIHGWVSNGRRTISPPESGFWSVWMQASGTVSIGEIPSNEARVRDASGARWAVSGFAGILRGGKVLPAASDVRHPRSAIGLGADGTTMVWLLVDGRRPGISEGVSEEELARLLLEAGCTEGINLDGGGSSSLWLRGTNGLSLMNLPSDRTGPRPVPTMLVLKHSRRRR